MIKKIIIFILLCICFTGCEKTNTPIEFTEQTFYRDESYARTFEMLYTQTDEINIGFLQGLYTDDEMQTTSLQIKKDVEVLDDLFGVGSYDKATVYILEATVDGGSYATSKNVFCTAEDLLSGEYQYALVEAYIGSNEPWIIYGLCENLFGQEVYDAFLTDYYLDTEDLSILSLFGGRFYPEWNTKEELEVARGTTTSFTKFILENYDIESFLNGANPDIKTKWLESIKVNKTYSYEYEDELHGFTYDSSDEYSLIITTDNASYMLNPMEDEGLRIPKQLKSIST